MESVTASQTVTAVVDNLSNKIGIAAEKVIPVANTVVEEIKNRGIAMGCIDLSIAVLAIATFVIVYSCCKKSVDKKRDGKWDDNSSEAPVCLIVTIISAILCAFTCLITIGSSISWFSQALAPTLYLVKTVMNN